MDRNAATRLVASAIAGGLFTLRSLDLKIPDEGLLRRKSSHYKTTSSSSHPLCKSHTIGEASFLSPLPGKRRNSITPIAQTAPTGRKGSVTELSPCINDELMANSKSRVLTLRDVAERIISRALELECARRSGPDGTSVYMEAVNCWFAEESDPPRQPLTAARVEPAEIICTDAELPSLQTSGGSPSHTGDRQMPSSTGVRLVNATNGDINEMTWLLGTVHDVAGATTYTRYVESKQPRSVHLMIGESIVPHKFKLTEPWRVAWKWLSKPSLIHYAKAAYLHAVAMTWAPVPDSVEGTWIYKMLIEPQTIELAVGPQPELYLDVGETAYINMTKQGENLALEQRRKGFVTFLWDMVMFWKGLYACLEVDLASWKPPNENLSSLGATILRYRLGATTSGRAPLGKVVLAAWSMIDHPRLTAFQDFDPALSLIVHIPSQLKSVNYKLKDIQRKDRILFYGYQLVPDESGRRDNSFTFGMSTGGILSSVALSTLKERCQYLFEIGEGFTTHERYVGVIHEALSGTGITASYDEDYACFYLMSPTVNALPDAERRFFFRSPAPRRDRLKFTTASVNLDLPLTRAVTADDDTMSTAATVVAAASEPTTKADPVATHLGLLQLLNDLGAKGGLLLLKIVDGSTPEYFLHPRKQPSTLR